MTAPARLDTLDAPYELASEQFELVARGLADDLLFGSDPSRFLGPGIDYVQSRRFVEGDALRDMDWRVTARTGRRHVREYEAPRRMPVHLLLDTSASMAIGAGALTKHAVGTWLAGALAFAALRCLRPVGLVDCGERGVRIAPTLAPAAVRRGLNALRSPGGFERTRLTRRLDETASVARCRSTIVVLSDLHEPGVLAALNRLAPRHDCMVIRLRDPAERQPLRAGFVRAREAETGRGFLVRSRSPALAAPASSDAPQTLSAEAHLVTIDTDSPIIPEMRAFLQTRSRFGRGGR